MESALFPKICAAAQLAVRAFPAAEVALGIRSVEPPALRFAQEAALRTAMNAELSVHSKRAVFAVLLFARVAQWTA